MTQQEMFGPAVWLGAKECKNTDAFVLRGHFTANGVKKATLRVLGLGFFHCYINGARVGDDLYLPLSSEYEPREDFPTEEQLSAFRIYVPEYDVSDLLRDGENVIAIHFGGGWYTFEQSIRRQKKKYGDPKAIWRIFGEGATGDFDFCSSTQDKLGKSFVTDFRFDRFEVHDYTKAPPGMFNIGFRDADWENATLARPLDTEYCFSDCPADGVASSLPVCVVSKQENATVYDCGRNISGTPVLHLQGKRGQTVRVILSEELNGNGDIDPKFSHKQEFVCVCDGSERLVRALFTWFGFRYLRVEGEATLPLVEFIHTKVSRISDFSCDNDTLNWIHSAFLTTQLANMHAGIPSDCPHIERRGYTGDGHLACRAAMKMLDTEAFYRKWLQDIADSQDKLTGHIQNTAPYTHSGGGLGGWGCAIVEMPWQFYLHYGDTAPLAAYYPNMLRYFDYLELHSANGLVVSDKAGEWCLGEWANPSPVILPAPFVNTYFYVRALQHMVEIAKLTGHEQDIPLFEARIATRKAAIEHAYLNTWDGNFFGCLQAGNAFALDLGLGDERTYQNLLAYYEGLGEFDTGIFGTELLIRLLFERGNGELAVRLLTSEKAHSFTEMKRRGATTLWEHFPDSYRDRSHSHPMFGAVVSHLYDYLLGIRQEGAGYDHPVIAPVLVPQINTLSGHRTLKTGRLCVAYKKGDGRVCFEIDIPKGQKADFLFDGQCHPLFSGKHTLSFHLK